MCSVSVLSVCCCGAKKADFMKEVLFNRLSRGDKAAFFFNVTIKMTDVNVKQPVMYDTVSAVHFPLTPAPTAGISVIERRL